MTIINDSILDSIKLLLGIPVSETSFDTTLCLHINSVFMILNQLGVGADTVFVIEDKTKTWAQFLPAGADAYLALVKSYMFLKVQSMFDPPTSGIVSTSVKAIIEQFEARLVMQVESEIV